MLCCSAQETCLKWTIFSMSLFHVPNHVCDLYSWLMSLNLHLLFLKRHFTKVTNFVGLSRISLFCSYIVSITENIFWYYNCTFLSQWTLAYILVIYLLSKYELAMHWVYYYFEIIFECYDLAKLIGSFAFIAFDNGLTPSLMLCYVLPCYVKSWPVMACYVMPCHVMSCHVMSCHVMSCHLSLC